MQTIEQINTECHEAEAKILAATGVRVLMMQGSNGRWSAWRIVPTDRFDNYRRIGRSGQLSAATPSEAADKAIAYLARGH